MRALAGLESGWLFFFPGFDGFFRLRRAPVEDLSLSLGLVLGLHTQDVLFLARAIVRRRGFFVAGGWSAEIPPGIVPEVR